ncbi:hypothetical protein R1CP_19855 [Rhodococcus opacus]|uniref:DUF1931 family protein n=1 Tax=Rhodococcus opacus TaxID=37919 RepID=A0A1B1K7P7_RHOOP|nr:DUF1931 family protein [Rhodococcus opacus]ANS28653.1 hypothetical protein R1CP_19855 [Rhodococcus opacus]
MSVMGEATFGHVFREVADIEVDRTDLPQCDAIVTDTLYRLLLTGQASAAIARRYIIEPEDLPITRGLREDIHTFTGLGHRIELERILTRLAVYPPLDRIPATETKAEFPDLVGGLTVALARTSAVVSPGVPRLAPGHWDALRSLVEIYL